MLTAQAHSITQQSRLAITLSWVAGYTNILTVLTCAQVTSHVSGVASELGRDVAQGRWWLAAYALAIMAIFFFGAALSGILTEVGRRQRWQSIYVWPIALEAGLLAAFAVMVELHDASSVETGGRRLLMTLLPAMAMGLQNATITRISGGVVRTTHITGVLTDAGLETAHQILSALFRKRRTTSERSAQASALRLWLLLSILGAFVVGSALGALAFGFVPRMSMIPPVLLLLWIIYQDVVSPIAELEHSPTIDSHGTAGLPPQIALYRVKASARHGRRPLRLPDLLAWVEHLSPAARVVVLDLNSLATLDENEALEIRALHLHLEANSRALVLAGVGPALYTRLEQERVIPEIQPLNVCHDLEIAVARAYVMMEIEMERAR